MPNFQIIALLFITCFFFSCHKDCDDDIVEIDFVDYEVDFFTTHPDWVFVPPTWELVTEQTLVREAHLEGATFQTLNETVLVKSAFVHYKIQDSTQFSVVQNIETLSAAAVVCYDFWDTEDFLVTEVPAEYITLKRDVVVQQGSGDEVPAEYALISKRVLSTPGQILAAEGERNFNRVDFRIPDTLIIESYLPTQIPAGAAFCEAGRSYRIN